ncbi:MAG: hypothetical protein LBM27_03510, partial [Lactobacillaceae bacterium]|nr:hypothetical protein [Lactobacillaceae bacterium]
MIYLAIAISFLATISIYPFFIKYLKAKSAGVSTKWYERQEQNEKNGTPVMGGLVFLAVALVVAIVLGLGTNTLTEMYPLIVATIGFGFIGLVDDIEKIIPDDASRNSFVLRFSDFFKKRAEKKGYDWGKGLTPPAKLTLQITFSAISAALVLVYAPHSSFNLIFTLIYFAFSLVWILGFSNATNITDGLDGLLTSLSIFSFLAFVFVIAKSPDAQQHLGLMYFDLLLITSLLAFLFFNKPKAQIFMGDTGSLALGALLAVNSLVIQ